MEKHRVSVNFQYPKTRGRRFNPKLISCATLPPSMAVSVPAAWYLLQNPRSETSTPFRDWKNEVGSQRGTLNKRANSYIHKDALTQAEQSLALCNNERLSIGSQVSTAYNASLQRNRTILLSILDAITTLVVRGIPLRGK